MKVAVIGCGSIGSRWTRLLKGEGHAIVVHDEDMAKQEIACLAGFVVAPKSAAHALFGAEAAFICTWSDSHLALARQAIEAGVKRVFIEKPLALSLDGVEELAQFAEERGVRVMVACNWRFHLAFKKRYGHLDRIFFRIPRRLDDEHGGGAWLDLGSHAMDLARFLGNPEAELDLAYNERPERTLYFDGGTSILNLAAADEMYVREMKHFLTANTPMNGLREAAETLRLLLSLQDAS